LGILFVRDEFITMQCDELRPQCKKCLLYGVDCNYGSSGNSLQLSVQGSFQLESISVVLDNSGLEFSGVNCAVKAEQGIIHRGPGGPHSKAIFPDADQHGYAILSFIAARKLSYGITHKQVPIHPLLLHLDEFHNGHYDRRFATAQSLYRRYAAKFRKFMDISRILLAFLRSSSRNLSPIP
jgi:hypothetical protein